MHMYTYTCVCVYIYTHVYIYIYMYVCIYIRIHSLYTGYRVMVYALLHLGSRLSPQRAPGALVVYCLIALPVLAPTYLSQQSLTLPSLHCSIRDGPLRSSRTHRTCLG